MEETNEKKNEEQAEVVSEKKQRSYNRLFVLLLIINLAFFGLLVFEIVSLFSHLK